MNPPDRPPFDPDAIPVLTERLYVPTLPPLMPVEEEPPAVPVVDAASLPTGVPEPKATPLDAADAPSAVVAAPVVPLPATAATAAAASPAPPALDIGVVRDAVLDDLERVLPGQIESLIRREVSNAIDDAVFRVVAETQDALARAIGQVVERAVKEELDRLRNEGG